MQMTPDTLTVSEILELRKNNMLTVNPEYQRGAVWNSAQQKKLIDSVLRSYPIPLIYLHHIRRAVAGMQRDDLEIIDGQQRINSFVAFVDGNLRLFDPVKDDREAKFPRFVQAQPCPWAGCTIETLHPDLVQRFLQTPLSLVKLDATPDEARDLFIRLQAGLPLNAQEKRDAWPGGFTEFVLKYGGKPEVARYQGHEFFKVVMRARAGAKRGKIRQLCAQMAMLLFERHESHAWTDISTKALDDFYYKHLDFDVNGPFVERFSRVLDILVGRLRDGKRRPMKGHEAIHLMLLADAMFDDYAAGWQERLPGAFDKFMASVAADKRSRHSPTPGEYWVNYDARTRTDSDRATTIRLRHEFFARKMLELMAPLQPKDPQRGYTTLERELIYWRDQKLCAVCRGEIAWHELEIHHVIEHTKGGTTTLDNGKPVHRSCHPKGSAALVFAGA